MNFPDLTKFPDFAYDSETTGLSSQTNKVFGFSISTPDGNDYYWDIRKNPEVVGKFNQQMATYEGEIICHNMSFDHRMSEATGINVPLANGIDTVVDACLINEHEFSYRLDDLAKKYTSHHKQGNAMYVEMAKIFGGRATRNVQMPRIADAPFELVSPYAKADTRATYALRQWQKGEIEKQDLHKIVKFERKLTPILIKAEKHGVRVDTRAAEIAVGEISVAIKEAQKRLNDTVGFACNPQPSGDIKKVFAPKWREGRWWANDGTPLKETDAGNASLGAEALRVMSHPAAGIILELRSLLKTRDTFLVGHVLESAHNGRVYPRINQNKGEDGGTGTGRLSVSEPALQQIPDRNKKVAETVKRVFLPDEGHEWVDADMASFEVRIFAHLIGTPDIVESYLRSPEQDFHQYVADLTSLVRNATYTGEPNAKQLNLSMIFNQGDGSTAEKMGMPWTWECFTPKGSKKEVVYKKAGKEAMAIINKYHKHLPGVKRLADGCKKVAEDRNWLFTREGRHLRFPRGHKAYKASGILIQATSADENKRNWMIIDDAISGTGAKMVLNTHDSYSLSVPKGKAELVARRVKEAVEEDRGLRVPLILEVQRPGNNWWESKQSKRWM